MISFTELKNKLSNFPKYKGTVAVPPAPLLNEGYPSNFNLSFAYYEWTKKEGQIGINPQYVSYTGEMFYTKCQPCIRHQDWEKVINGNPEKYRYLPYFHMADVSGLIARLDSSHRKEIGDFAIKSLIDFFLMNSLDLKKVYVTYSGGGTVSDLTDGKYSFDQSVYQDPFFQTWIDAGIPIENMTADFTRDTLLSLRNYDRPSPWGYRNEVLYMHQEKLLDIATVEHLCFEPIFSDDMNIINIKEYRHSFSISALGVERFLMVLNNLPTINEIDIIKPLYLFLKKEIPDINQLNQDRLIQTLRAIQAIVVDGGVWKTLNARRKELARSFYMVIADTLFYLNIGIGEKVIKDILELNAKLLKHVKMIEVGPEPVVNEIKERVLSMANNKDLPLNKRENYKKIINR